MGLRSLLDCLFPCLSSQQTLDDDDNIPTCAEIELREMSKMRAHVSTHATPKGISDIQGDAQNILITRIKSRAREGDIRDEGDMAERIALDLDDALDDLTAGM